MSDTSLEKIIPSIQFSAYSKGKLCNYLIDTGCGPDLITEEYAQDESVDNKVTMPSGWSFDLTYNKTFTTKSDRIIIGRKTIVKLIEANWLLNIYDYTYTNTLVGSPIITVDNMSWKCIFDSGCCGNFDLAVPADIFNRMRVSAANPMTELDIVDTHEGCAETLIMSVEGSFSWIEKCDKTDKEILRRDTCHTIRILLKKYNNSKILFGPSFLNNRKIKASLLDQIASWE